MHARTTIKSIAAVALAVVAACSPPKPRTYGNSYDQYTPKVTPTKGERLPQHLTVDLARSANVAIFLVLPGRGIQLLYPADSTSNGFITQGQHLIETSVAKNALTDTSRLTRLPGQSQQQPQQGRNGRGAFDPSNLTGISLRGFLMIYASQDPLNYNTLKNSVAGISIPIDDDDALNTVWKLVRERTRTTGQWAAYATDFPP